MYLCMWRAFALSISTLLNACLTPSPNSLDQSVTNRDWRASRYPSAPQPPLSLPHDNPTKSFWTHGAPDANPLAKVGSTGELISIVDTAIIGSGITGVGVAYHLSKLLNESGLSHKVSIFEARDFCSGATGRNGGHLVPNVFSGFNALSAMYNVDEAVRSLLLENHTAEAILSILKSSRHEAAVDLVGPGRLSLFFSENEESNSKADWAAARDAGVDVGGVQFLSKYETELKYGPLFPSVRTPGHNLWPLKAVTHFFRLAQGISELHLYTHTPVVSVKPADSSLQYNGTVSPPRWILETPRGTVHAYNVIHATNGYAAHLLPFLTGTNGREGIVPTRGQALSVRASVGEDKISKLGFVANDGNEYWFPRPLNASAEENPLIILGGGRQAASPGYELGITDDSVVNPIVSQRLREFLPSTYPVGWFDAKREPEMEWTGIMGYTQSTAPYVGPVVDASTGVPLVGQYIAAGYTGHGMPRAFGCAEALAQMIVSDMRNETWVRPEWFPDHFLTTSEWRSRWSGS